MGNEIKVEKVKALRKIFSRRFLRKSLPKKEKNFPRITQSIAFILNPEISAHLMPFTTKGRGEFSLKSFFYRSFVDLALHSFAPQTKAAPHTMNHFNWITQFHVVLYLKSVYFALRIMAKIWLSRKAKSFSEFSVFFFSFSVGFIEGCRQLKFDDGKKGRRVRNEIEESWI